MRTIDSEADIAEGLDYLLRRDRRLRKVLKIAGTVPLRRRPDGFEGLVRIIMGQQVSVASASAISDRFLAAFPGVPIEIIRKATDDELRAPGLSMAKIKAVRAAATAISEGLDLAGLAGLPAEEAHNRLTAVKGIGPWTADLYLLFCIGHQDIFPAGDLALRNAVADAFGLAALTIDETEAVAVKWSPWRGVAAWLFWAYYRAKRQRTALPL
jgi:DNA-3-methyladenine glycosylase II